MLIGVQPSIDCARRAAKHGLTGRWPDRENDGPVALIEDVEIRQADGLGRDADVAVVEADIPVPLLVVPDVERALEAGRDLIVAVPNAPRRLPSEARRASNVASPGRTRRRTGCSSCPPRSARRRRASRTGASWNADEVLLCMTDGIDLDVVGQLVVAVEEEARAFLRRHDQVDGREVVLVARAVAVRIVDVAVVVGRDVLAARAGIAREEAASGIREKVGERVRDLDVPVRREVEPPMEPRGSCWP